jgi:hypothetical protein
MGEDVVQYKPVEMLRQSRMFILEQIKDLNAQQLNKIPSGFNNNLIWNVGHLIWAQQNDCYKRLGLNIKVDEKYFFPYKTGSKPGLYIDENEIFLIKELLLTTIDQASADLKENVFVVDDGIVGLSLHDWLHTGYILALRRLVQ